MIIVIVFLCLLVFCIFKRKKENYSNYYDKLKNDWSKIFPKGNRNAGGPQFFKYIMDLDVGYNDFLEYNKLYCAVSGSLVSPGSAPQQVYLEHISTGKLICGNYYLCCWPCACDLMKYAKVGNIDYKGNTIHVLVIDDPCNKELPKEISKNNFCKGNTLDSSKVYKHKGKLVIGVLHNAKECSDDDKNKIDDHEITGKKCRERNNTKLEDLNYGMGDIFIKLAN